MTGWRKKQIENIKAGEKVVCDDDGEYKIGSYDAPEYKEIKARWAEVIEKSKNGFPVSELKSGKRRNP